MKKQKEREKKAAELLHRVANNIRKRRTELKMTQKELEECSGLRIYKYESGNNDMTLTTLCCLSEHLKVEVWELVK